MTSTVTLAVDVDLNGISTCNLIILLLRPCSLFSVYPYTSLRGRYCLKDGSLHFTDHVMRPTGTYTISQ